jgi:hypothetical protein
MKTINIDVTSHSLAPLYRRFNDASPPQPAFLQLNPENGHVSFGVRPDHVITAAEEKGQLLRWPILPEIRGSHCLAVAEALRPLLQTVQNGYYEQLDDSDKSELLFIGLLDEEAERARDRIGTLVTHLIDRRNPDHVCAVCYPEDFIRDWIAQHGEIGPSTTDEQLDQLARDYLHAAADEGVFVDGSLRDALTSFRTEIRESALSR